LQTTRNSIKKKLVPKTPPKNFPTYGRILLIASHMCELWQ